MIEDVVVGKCQNPGDDEAVEDQAVAELIKLFNEQFFISHNTELVKGGHEPIYLPADESHPHHRVVFAHGFFNSALHEIAHWCVAGLERRQLEDFGYWYEPDGRTLEQQKIFETVEVKPQALEWILTLSAGRKFRVSADNLGLAARGVQHDDSCFKENIWKEVQRRFDVGLPERVECLSTALIERFQPGLVLEKQRFKLEDL